MAGSIYVYNVEAKHKAHLDHLLEENDGVLPQPPAYEYLNRRVKPFPWGMNSLFYNPKVHKNQELSLPMTFANFFSTGQQEHGGGIDCVPFVFNILDNHNHTLLTLWVLTLINKSAVQVGICQ